MSRRFFVETRLASSHARLVGSEADHLIRVLRAQVGDEVVLFDGSGAEFRSRLVSVGRSEVDLQVLERCVIDRELSPPLLLAVALPKGDRQRWLVEKAVELGVSQLIPLATERGVAQPVDRAVQRLQRAVIEASKQCGRNRLMTISSPQTIAECLAAAPPDCQRWLIHPGNHPDRYAPCSLWPSSIRSWRSSAPRAASPSRNSSAARHSASSFRSDAGYCASRPPHWP
jgi:16S rRNA (uracil1498-N3)-methyltransferase